MVPLPLDSPKALRAHHSWLDLDEVLLTLDSPKALRAHNWQVVVEVEHLVDTSKALRAQLLLEGLVVEHQTGA
jgi:hypothetical protein